MFELIKIVGVSAVLSAGLVTASEMQPQPAAAGAKIYVDRLPDGEAVRLERAAFTEGRRDQDQGGQALRDNKGDSLGRLSQSGCAAQAWPHIDQECLTVASGTARASVRMVTIEQRPGGNTSVLVRVPAAELPRY